MSQRTPSSDLKSWVKATIGALYEVEVVAHDPKSYLKEKAEAVPIYYLVNLAHLTGAKLPKRLRMFARRKPR